MSLPNFYVIGGTLRSDAPCYVEREADSDLYHALIKGEFCYVLTSRQMGKSSLMVRTAARLRKLGTNVLVLDLGAIGQTLTPEQWYTGLLVNAGEQLALEEELQHFWVAHLHLGLVQRWFAALHKIVLNARPGPLVIFLDEIDSVRSLSFVTDDFFAAIRSCYNRRSEEPDFNRLVFCLLGVATPSDLIRDPRMTPFNIGCRIELNDFTPEEAAPLASGLHPDPSRATILLRRVLHWTNGHPYLTQRLCGALAQTSQRHIVDRCCEELFLLGHAQQRDDNLIFVRERLLRSQPDLMGLLQLYLRVWKGRHVADDESNPLVSTLRLSGVVRPTHGLLRNRNRIYHRVFDRQWVQTNLPDAEVRRQRAAFWLGVLRTSTIALAVVGALVVMLVVTVTETKKAYVDQANAIRAGGSQGQRYESLLAIKHANWFFSNKENLRNLAAKSLALVDLKPNQAWSIKAVGQQPFTLSPDFGVYALSSALNSVTVSSTNGHTLARLPASELPIVRLVFSPNGQWLAVQHEQDLAAELLVWDWRHRTVILRLTNRMSGQALEFSPDSRRLACGQPDGKLLVYALESGNTNPAPLLSLTNRWPRPANSLRFHPTRHLLAQSSSASLNVQIWDLATAQVRHTFYHRDPVFDLAWHPDGQWLATACHSGEIYLWDLDHPETRRLIGRHEGEVHHLAFTYRGNLLASVGADRTLRLWVPFTGRQMIHQLNSIDEVEALTFRPDDRQLGWRRFNSQIQLWDLEPAWEYQVLLTQTASAEPIVTADFSPDGRWLVVTSNDGMVMWDTVSGSKTVNLFALASTQAAFFNLSSGDLLVSSSLYGWHRARWMPHSQTPAFQLDAMAPVAGLANALGPFALARNGKIVAVLHSTNEIYAFDPEQPSNLSTIQTSTNRYQSLALSPDGKWLAARLAPDQEVHAQATAIHIWDVVKGVRSENTPAFEAGPDFAFSPLTEWLVTTTATKVHFWRVDNWQSEYIDPNYSGPIAFSANGKLIAMTQPPSTIELRGSPRGPSILKLENPDRKPVRGLAFSYDGRKLAAISSDQLIMLWDLSRIATNLSNLGLKTVLPFSSEKSVYDPKTSSTSVARF